MKRELKDNLYRSYVMQNLFIARLIPMKRELKGYPVAEFKSTLGMHRKAHPDEKGTESRLSRFRCLMWANIARLIPMKRELKEYQVIGSIRY